MEKIRVSCCAHETCCGGFCAASGKIGKSGAMADVEIEVKSATAAVNALSDIVKSVEVRGLCDGTF